MTSPVLVLIPARMASTRLPGKPLADMAGKPMIVRVAERAAQSGLGDVVVATDTQAIVNAVESHGHRAVMTRSDHMSGSDRIFEALTKLDAQGRYEIVVNVQGDFPTIEPAAIQSVLAPLQNLHVDIGTIAFEIVNPAERTNPNVVKLVGSPLSPDGLPTRRLRALYFTRATAPYGEGPLYHHIGIYAYRRAALERFVTLPPSVLERRESLEQLRALEAGMRIDAEIIESRPFGVDSPDDLERARTVFASSSSFREISETSLS